MPDKTNPKWAREQRALKKIQVHFTFTAHASTQLKIDAVKTNMTTTNYVRKLVGLDYEEIARDRIGLSLSPDDFDMLAKRYGVDPGNREEIKRLVTQEINLQYYDKGSRE